MFSLLNLLIFQTIIFPAVTVMHFPSTIPFLCFVIFLTILTLFVVSYEKNKTSKSKIIPPKFLIFTLFLNTFHSSAFFPPLQSIPLHNRVHTHCARLHCNGNALKILHVTTTNNSHYCKLLLPC